MVINEQKTPFFAIFIYVTARYADVSKKPHTFAVGIPLCNLGSEARLLRFRK
jgi:hypothetical protein